MSLITFQIQLEPDTYGEKDLAVLHKRMVDFVLSIQSYGYLRWEMFVGEEAYVATKK